MDSLINTGDFSWSVPDPGQAFLANTAASWSGIDETFWAFTPTPERRKDGGGGRHHKPGRHQIVLPTRGVSPNKNDELLALTALLAVYYAYD